MPRLIYLLLLVFCISSCGLDPEDYEDYFSDEETTESEPSSSTPTASKEVTDENDEKSISQEVPANPGTDPDNAHTRVVWVQDVGDGGDTFGAGGNLRLMGLDTVDGVGERAILSTVGSYVRPLITPRGDRVVYSDRIRKKVYVVNWNGAGLREIVSGFALAVWMDPRGGREWVYFGDENWGPDRDHTTEVYRMPLDGSGSRELIWNKTPVMVVGFQLSADGRMASGNFPWPDGGVADLPGGSWTKFGTGCWASLAPDNSYNFWIFDDSHRNLFITDVSGENGRWVNINGAPGIDGYEVYHPRWSNHPRIMAMTGPYKMGSGTNRIAGGGPEVEIYIGRFNADLTAIEFWRQVTKNDRGDFYPDVWISP